MLLAFISCALAGEPELDSLGIRIWAPMPEGWDGTSFRTYERHQVRILGRPADVRVRVCGSLVSQIALNWRIEREDAEVQQYAKAAQDFAAELVAAYSALGWKEQPAGTVAVLNNGTTVRRRVELWSAGRRTAISEGGIRAIVETPADRESLTFYVRMEVEDPETARLLSCDG